MTTYEAKKAVVKIKIGDQEFECTGAHYVTLQEPLPAPFVVDSNRDLAPFDGEFRFTLPHFEPGVAVRKLLDEQRLQKCSMK